MQPAVAAASPKYADRTVSNGPYNAQRLADVAARQAVLDFSFLDLTDAEDLLRTEPRHGKKWNAREDPDRTNQTNAGPSAGSASKQHGPKEGVSADATAWDFGDKRGQTERTKDGFLVVRAKNETYAFKDDDELRKLTAGVHAKDTYRVDSKGRVIMLDAVQKEPSRYYCTTLRLDNNRLTSGCLAYLPSILSVLTVNASAHLTVLDLSFNMLTALPSGLDNFPLHSLNLHCNRIGSMTEVAKLQLLHRTLRRVTLNENPVQRSTDKFKYAVLHTLPFLKFLDDVRVTDKDRERIAVYEELFVPAKKRGSTRKFLPPIAPSPTSH